MYEEGLQYVEAYLLAQGGDRSQEPGKAFRSRIMHTRRVLMWLLRLLEHTPVSYPEDVKMAAIFHDIGYSATENNLYHAARSTLAFRKYAEKKQMDPERVERIAGWIARHSRKELMADPETPLELILLMEADMLDEEGLMGIMWDLLSAGAQPVTSYEEGYMRMLPYAHKFLQQQPMRTAYAREIWQGKQQAVRKVMEQLAFDLGKEFH